MKGDLRKEQILEASTAVFAEHGFERTSIAMICEKIKIGRGTLYQYFKDKNALFRELLQKHARRVEALMATSVVDETISSLEEFMYYRQRRVMQEIRDNKEIYMILLHEAPAKNCGVDDLVRAIRRRMIHDTAEDLRLGTKLGFYQVEDPELVATFFIGAVLHAVEYYFFDAEVPADPDELARKIVQFELKYLVDQSG